MTQPRKEQVKNIKAKSIRMDLAGTVQLGGTTVQNLENTISAQAYDDFLAQSITEIINGADEHIPPRLYGGFGPFNVVAGNSFTLHIPGVNNGLSMNVQIQTSDIVNIGGNPVLTASRAAARINSTLSTYGVTTPVASSAKGRLILTGADTSGRIYGDDASITISDVTIGITNTLGFGITPVNAVGITAPARGIITVSDDGLGGYVSLRKDDKTPAVTFNPSLLTFPAPGNVLRYTEEIPPAQPIYARLRQFPGPHDNGIKFELSYHREGLVRANLVTSKSDFSSLSAADTVTFNISDPSRGINQTVVVTFTVGITSPLNVVNVVNGQWDIQTGVITGYNAGSAVARLEVPGPFAFEALESFFISFQTTLPIHINPGSSVTPVVTVTDLVNFINQKIIAASAATQGVAAQVVDPVTNQPKVIIKSINTLGLPSTVTIYPGNPGGSSPAGYMVTLEKVGLVPGTFKGSGIAAVCGNDEITFFNPSYSAGSSITISGTLATMARLGFSAVSASNTATYGADITPAPFVHALIPEMMEFGEVPDGNDIEIQEFSLTEELSHVNPITGMSNFGLSSIIGPDGKIVSDFVPKRYPFLAVDQLDLGKNLTGSSVDQSKPRVTASFNTSNGPVLLWEGTSTQGNSQLRTRHYQTAPGITIELTNATYDGTSYVKDVEGVRATRILKWEGSVLYSIIDEALASPWLDVDWNSTVSITPWDAPFIGRALISLGDESHESLTQNVYVPRIQFSLQDSVPSLISQGISYASGGSALRRYNVSISGGGSFFTDTVNAYQDDTGNWNKDATGYGATSVIANDLPSYAVFFRQDVNDAPWIAWDVIPYLAIGSTLLPSGAVNIMNSPLKVPSVRRAVPNPIYPVTSGGTVQLYCLDGVDKFIFFIGTTCLISLIDMTTFMLYTIGDEFEVVISHVTGTAQVTPDPPTAWGPGVVWENAFDGWLSNKLGATDVYTFKSYGIDQTLANRILLGSVKRYWLFP